MMNTNIIVSVSPSSQNYCILFVARSGLNIASLLLFTVMIEDLTCQILGSLNAEGYDIAVTHL